MITRRIASSRKWWTSCAPNRNVQISVIGAAGDIGSSLSLLLKQNPKVKHLKLYDDDERIKGVGIELALIPGGPSVTAYGPDNLGPAVRSSDIIAMVSRTARRLGNTREEMIAANASPVQQLCRAIVNQNPDAFLAISTNPINSIVPFASACLCKYNCYNPFKVLGITHIDTARTRAFAGNALQVNPMQLQIPVIGGHSDQTIVPLFSNLYPYSVDPCQADMLTRLVRKAGTEVILHKNGLESSTIAMAWSIYEFLDGLIDAVYGSEVVLNCFTANPNFGARFFSGPTNIGCSGIVHTCCNFAMNDFENSLLTLATAAINKDIAIGEGYVNYIEGSVF